MVFNGYLFGMDVQSCLFTNGDNTDAGYPLENMPALTSSTVGGVWPSQRSSVPRRNSTSALSAIAATRNRMNMNGLTSVSNIIPETSAATLTAAASILNTVAAEERFRSRAYSEGASSLSSESQLQQQQQQQQSIASSRYKTELCRPFEENGKCKYGDKCQFAHGKQELRPLIRHPKYKTELCRTFHTSGFCPYGPRCHFIHNQEDSVNRGNSIVQSPGSTLQQHTAFSNRALSSACVPIPVPNAQLSERNHFDHRPSRPNVLTKQLSAGPTFGGHSYSPPNQSPIGGSPPFFSNDVQCSALMSPISPGQTGSTMFNFNLSNNANGFPSTRSSLPFDSRQSTPPMSTYDLLQTQGSLLDNVSDDSAFEGPPTPPDSDRESMTGSPASRQQRLPIFRCLSRSE